MRLALRALVLLTFGLAVCALRAGDVDAGPAKQPCQPRGAKAVHRTTTILVVRRRDGAHQACLRRGGRVRRLDRPNPGIAMTASAATAFASRDRFLAHEIYVSGRSRSDVTVRVVDLASGKRVLEAQAYEGAESAQVNAKPVTDLELLGDGTAAWISPRPDETGASEVRVARPHTGSSVLLASSTAVDPRSLAMNRRYVYWSERDGSLRRAPLP